MKWKWKGISKKLLIAAIGMCAIDYMAWMLYGDTIEPAHKFELYMAFIGTIGTLAGAHNLIQGKIDAGKILSSVPVVGQQGKIKMASKKFSTAIVGIFSECFIIYLVKVDTLDQTHKIELYGIIIASIMAIAGVYNYVEGENDKLKKINGGEIPK